MSTDTDAVLRQHEIEENLVFIAHRLDDIDRRLEDIDTEIEALYGAPKEAKQDWSPHEEVLLFEGDDS